jgi:hypothetical protein
MTPFGKKEFVLYLCRLPKQEHYFEITKCYSQILTSEFQAKFHGLPFIHGHSA